MSRLCLDRLDTASERLVLTGLIDTDQTTNALSVVLPFHRCAAAEDRETGV